MQCIYFDPPYGIKFNSNWQVSTQIRDVKDGKQTDITREPEQVKAFRDTWKDGIHSYLTYLRDRLTAMRDLLTESGSIFVQIGDENVHRVRAVMDEVFGEENFAAEISVSKTTGQTSQFLSNTNDYILWYFRDLTRAKFRRPLVVKGVGGEGASGYTKVREASGVDRPLTAAEKSSGEFPAGARPFASGDMTSQKPPGRFEVRAFGKAITPSKGYWKTGEVGMRRLIAADRLISTASSFAYRRYLDDFSAFPLANVWTDTVGQNRFGGEKIYVVQTGLKVVQRCILMATDPGDLVLDPTCGSGTTAYRRRAMGPALDHDRHQPRGAGAGADAADGGALSLVSARRQPRGPRQGSGTHRSAHPPTRPSTTISARASSTSACRTSCSGRSPTIR